MDLRIVEKEDKSPLCERLGHKRTRGTEVLGLHLCLVEGSLFLHGGLSCRPYSCAELELQ